MHSSDTLHLVTAPLGNLAAYDVGERVVERILIASDDLAKRVLRLETSRGDIGVRFAAGEQGVDGDVLYADERVVIALDVTPDDVLVCRPRTIPEALGIAHALGNRHVPVQIESDALVVRYDRLVEDLLLASDVAYAREYRKLGTPFRHAHAPHGDA